MYRERNYRLLIQYDGRPFSGWQRQKNGLSIQECLEDAIQQVCKNSGPVVGSGRTDAGVHARGQVASVRMTTRLKAGELIRALNSILPIEIRILSLRTAPKDFNAQTDAIEKIYRYLIQCSSDRSPFSPWYAHWISHKLDIDNMRKAAKHLVGTHDFSSFMASGSSVKTTVRTIKSISIKHGGPMVSINVTAGGFLRHMVRCIAGTLIAVGLGKKSPEEVKDILEAKDRTAAGPTAPATGLTLMRVVY